MQRVKTLKKEKVQVNMMHINQRITNSVNIHIKVQKSFSLPLSKQVHEIVTMQTSA